MTFRNYRHTIYGTNLGLRHNILPAMPRKNALKKTLHLQLAPFPALKERGIQVPPYRRLTAQRSAHRRRRCDRRRRLPNLLVVRHARRAGR